MHSHQLNYFDSAPDDIKLLIQGFLDTKELFGNHLSKGHEVIRQKFFKENFDYWQNKCFKEFKFKLKPYHDNYAAIYKRLFFLQTYHPAYLIKLRKNFFEIGLDYYPLTHSKLRYPPADMELRSYFLKEAVFLDNLPFICYLIFEGANHTELKLDKSTLDSVTQYGSLMTLQFFLTYFEKFDPSIKPDTNTLNKAFLSGNKLKAKFLLEKNAEQKNENFSPTAAIIESAVKSGNVEIIQYAEEICTEYKTTYKLPWPLCSRNKNNVAAIEYLFKCGLSSYLNIDLMEEAFNGDDLELIQNSYNYYRQNYPERRLFGSKHLCYACISDNTSLKTFEFVKNILITNNSLLLDGDWDLTLELMIEGACQKSNSGIFKSLTELMQTYELGQWTQDMIDTCIVTALTDTRSNLDLLKAIINLAADNNFLITTASFTFNNAAKGGSPEVFDYVASVYEINGHDTKISEDIIDIAINNRAAGLLYYILLSSERFGIEPNRAIVEKVYLTKDPLLIARLNMCLINFKKGLTFVAPKSHASATHPNP